MRIIEDATLVDTVEDWSRVRSVGRAWRRRKLGHRQNIRITGKPKTSGYVMTIKGEQVMVCHPSVAQRLKAATQEVETGSKHVAGGLFRGLFSGRLW